MANFIQTTDLTQTRFVTPTSRYINSAILYYGDANRLTFETYKRKTTPQTTSDKFMVISKGSEFRPDLVSQDVYGFPDFWWKILQANNMFDIFDFKAGTNIRIPSVSI